MLDTLSSTDAALLRRYLGELRPPDVTLGRQGAPYIYRWHVVPRNTAANVYLHVQVADDPGSPLHDHPWDNMSVILAGGYMEQTQYGVFHRRPGDVIMRRAEHAHHLRLVPGVTRSISLFTTGPVVRDWGFLTPAGWVHHTHLVHIENVVSGTKKPTR